MNPQKFPLSDRVLYTAYALRDQDVHHKAESFHRRNVFPVKLKAMVRSPSPEKRNDDENFLLCN